MESDVRGETSRRQRRRGGKGRTFVSEEEVLNISTTEDFKKGSEKPIDGR